MPIEQQPRTNCEICGGTHATTEHDTITHTQPHESEATELIRYKESQGLEKKIEFAEKVKMLAEKFDFPLSRWAIQSASARLLARAGRYEEAQTLLSGIQGEASYAGVTVGGGNEYHDALKDIVVAMAKDNRLKDAEDVIEQAALNYKPDYLRDSVRAQAYGALATFLTLVGKFDEAKIFVEKMENYPSWRAQILSKVALAEVRAGNDATADFEEAIDITQKSADIGVGPGALKYIAADMVRAGMVEEAMGLQNRRYLGKHVKEGGKQELRWERIIDLNKPAYGMIRGLSGPAVLPAWYPINRAIARALVEIGRIDEAKNFMDEKGIDSADRASLLKDIAVAQAQSGKDPSSAFKESQTEAEKIKNHLLSVETWSEIAISEVGAGVDPMVAFERAKTEATKMKTDKYHQAIAFGIIAKALVRAGYFENAMSYAKTLEPYSSNIALKEIIKALAETGQYKEAMGVVGQLDPKSQPYSLIDLLKVLANDESKTYELE